LAIYYRNAHAISLKVFFPTKPIVLADWFSFMQKPNVIVRVPEKKESGRKANRNPANGIQKIEIMVYGDLPRAPNVTVCRPLECSGPSQITHRSAFRRSLLAARILSKCSESISSSPSKMNLMLALGFMPGGVYDDPDGKLDGLARPYVLTGGYVELAR
jgi:hypothetical protein